MIYFNITKIFWSQSSDLEPGGLHGFTTAQLSAAILSQEESAAGENMFYKSSLRLDYSCSVKACRRFPADRFRFVLPDSKQERDSFWDVFQSTPCWRKEDQRVKVSQQRGKNPELRDTTERQTGTHTHWINNRFQHVDETNTVWSSRRSDVTFKHF